MGPGQQEDLHRRGGLAQSLQLRKGEVHGGAGRAADLEQVAGDDQRLRLALQAQVHHAREAVADDAPVVGGLLAQRVVGGVQMDIGSMDQLQGGSRPASHDGRSP